MSDATSLGPCCACRTSTDTRNLIALERRSPTPGRGWGCLVCGLPPDGAMAALCDPCLAGYEAGTVQIRDVCTAHPATDGRTAIDALAEEVFDHDMSKHPEVLASLQ
jgi:hypothetical protein